MLVGQLKESEAINFLHFSVTRMHITGIQIRKDEHGFLYAKIADSLENNTDEYSMVLNAIKETNQICHNAIVQRLDSALSKEQQSLIGLTISEYDGKNFVSFVQTQKQQTTNSCGLHSVINLYALNENPNIIDTSQFG